MLGCLEDLEPIVKPSALDTIKVGVILPFELEIGTKYGVQLAMAQINQEGGISGRPLELIIRDNQSDGELSARLAEELITKDGVSDYIREAFK